MEKTLCQSGEVLFDELEQIAVRRGGFASLKWLRDGDPELKSIQKALRNKGTRIDISKLDAYLSRVGAAVASVDDLGEITAARLKAANQVSRVAVEVMSAGRDVVDRLGKAREELNRLLPGGGWLQRMRRTFRRWIGSIECQDPLKAEFDDYQDEYHNLVCYLDKNGKCRDCGMRDASDVAECNVMDGLCTKLEKLKVEWVAFREEHGGDSVECKAFDSALRANFAYVYHCRFLATSARVSSQLAGIPGAGTGSVAQAEQPEDPSLQELTDLEQASQALDQALTSYRLIRRLREIAIDQTRMARWLVMPEPPDPPLGFIGRWLRRLAWNQVRPINPYSAALFEMDDIVTDTAYSMALRMNTVGLAFSGGGIRSATFNLGVLQGLADLGLIKKFDYLSTVSGGGYIGAWLASWIRREGGQAGEPPPADQNDPVATQERQAEIDRKRERTAGAIENVQTQLQTSRYSQSHAQRRWATPEELASGVEGKGRSLERVVEEEPEPIYHLRAYSNYLSPKVGLSSADTWTMVSVYLRNLMLNQFILLPLVLALVLAPRVLLWFFSLDLAQAPNYWHAYTEWLMATLMVATSFYAFFTTYRVIARIRSGRRRGQAQPVAKGVGGFESSLAFVAVEILFPMTLVAFCLSILFGHRLGHGLGAWFYPASLLLSPFHVDEDQRLITYGLGLRVLFAAVAFGGVVGFVRFLGAILAHLRFIADPGERTFFRAIERSRYPFLSAFIAAAGLYVVFSLIRWSFPDHQLVAPFIATFGVPIVLLVTGIGSSIEVGLIGGYEEEDMREWRASLGAYFLMIAASWILFVGLSLYGPLLIWLVNVKGSLGIAAGWLTTSILGVLSGKSAQTGDGKRNRVLDSIALAAPLVFLTGLLVAIAMLACLFQGIKPPLSSAKEGPSHYFELLMGANVGMTLGLFVLFASAAFVGCAKIDVNLFSMNLFYTNRLVRCYLGASRPQQPMDEGRPITAPSHCPVPARRANPLTGFDPDDDFPLKDLAIVRKWEADDLACDYRGPYHLINTAMNLVAGSELAWQERMAESFLLSPLYCGSRSTGYRKGVVTPNELGADQGRRTDDATPVDGLVKGYAADVRLGTAVSISGAAASPNMGYHSSPLVSILLTVFNVRLGLWLPNPSKIRWRQSGPGFSSYLLDELTGRTTSKGQYVYLSDGGHFENLGVYELIRRRCRYVVVCDAGADPESAFWDLGNLVRKCREDFGVRIEVDIAPLLKSETTGRSRWHCAVGSIRYDEVDDHATPGVLLYLKPSITGDEPSDIRNYVVEHPSFPHETTADQFFSESQFESYRELGAHVASRVFKDVEKAAIESREAGSLFRKLKRRWFPAIPELGDRLLKSIEPFVQAQAALREDPHLRRLSRQLYPELHTDGRNDMKIVQAEIHAVSQMLQAMENAWLEVDLEGYAEHPLNRGWMNVFRRWTNSEAFQNYWPALRGEFTEGFVRFCENELNLSMSSINAKRIDLINDKAWFETMVRDLDREFLREWPTLLSPWGGPPQPLSLEVMLKHSIGAGKPRWLKEPAAWLLGSGPTANSADSGAQFYGVILGWRPDPEPDVLELMVWVRGAYRTLGIGRGALEAVMAEIRQDARESRKTQFTLRSTYPGEGLTVAYDRGQGTVWLNFFLNHEFSRCTGNGNGYTNGNGKPNANRPLTVERLVHCR